MEIEVDFGNRIGRESAVRLAARRRHLGIQKEEFMIKIVGLLLVAAIATYGLHAFAQIRADVRPSMTPVGSSSANGISFAWFYDSTDRSVFVCRIGQAPGDTVDCTAKATLQ